MIEIYASSSSSLTSSSSSQSNNSSPPSSSSSSVSTVSKKERRVIEYKSYKHLIQTLFSKSFIENDANLPIVIVLHHNKSHNDNKESNCENKSLDDLSNEELDELLTFFFNHLNFTVSTIEDYDKLDNISINETCISNRLVRVGNWVGLLQQDHCTRVETMCDVIQSTISKSRNLQITQFCNTIFKEIDFFKILTLSKSKDELVKYVWNWEFPAHELNNDDLIYCAFIIINHVLESVRGKKENEDIIIDDNHLLGLIFIVRNSYKNGNPFHNFRHAVDVLQANFYFLIKLGCIRGDNQSKVDAPYLNDIQVLGLLIATLGHDVGHPGTTNAFMISNNSPIALIYNDHSVLESFHTFTFINRILKHCWPKLLNTKIDTNSQSTIKDLIISSILATDMGEHFEYIHRLEMFTTDHSYNHNFNLDNRIKLICALLIKCADISNVTRPLRISAQWAMVLSREFEEVNMLDRHLNSDLEINVEKDIIYPPVPFSLEEILNIQPKIHKGQIFFINTFAENLFKNIVDIFPQLEFTSTEILKNKHYWLNKEEDN